MATTCIPSYSCILHGVFLAKHMPSARDKQYSVNNLCRFIHRGMVHPGP